MFVATKLLEVSPPIYNMDMRLTDFEVPPVFTAGPKREEKNHSSLIIKHRRSVRGGAGGTGSSLCLVSRLRD